MNSPTDKHAQMIPVPIQDFIAGAIVPVNLYVRLGTDKFVLVSKSGQKTNRDQLKTYENKTVEYLWVKRNEYTKFVRNNITIAGVIVTQDNLDIKQKTEVLTQAAASVFAEMDNVGLGFESYSHSKQIVEATVSMAENHRDLSDLLLSLKDCNDVLLRHSMAVCCVSVLIAHALKWENKQTVEKLALGALLHDVGLKVLPPDLVNKPRAKMSYDELQLYEQHPYKGMQMLLGLGIVPDDVIAIVYEHQENAIGQGYPRKLRNIKIHPLAKVVALADEFCDLTLANPNCPVPRSPREALLTIEVTMGQPHNREAFRALQMVVNKEFAKAG
jgi:putative nucleotidyltransferase with HDIG domain